MMKISSRITRRQFLRTAAVVSAVIGAAPLSSRSLAAPRSHKGMPVILTTDIGDDIDDTWALGFLLKCPELDLKLAVTDYGKAEYRAKLLAKFLMACGRSDVAVGKGADVEPRGSGPQSPWIEKYDLAFYPGKVHEDGAQAIIDTIMMSSTPVTLICIGPMPTVAAALSREPRIATRARFVGMDGSIRVGYGGSKEVCAEWNVKAAPGPARQALSAPWDITITPLDTCGLVSIDGARYQRLLDSKDPVVRAIIDNYRIWSWSNKSAADAEHRSTTLFDTVAVYLAFAHNLCKMERLKISVTEDGFTRIDPTAKEMEVATAWKDLDGYRDFLVNRLLSQ